jgi:GTP-binding protein
VRLDFISPARGLIGFRGQFLTLTSGTGILTSRFDHYGPLKPDAAIERRNGVLVSMVPGKALAYALYTLQERGKLIVDHGTEVYEGMLIGINMRASGNDENIVLTPPIRFTLEQAIEFLDDDELVEITPQHIRLRKKHLTENERKRAGKKG